MELTEMIIRWRSVVARWDLLRASDPDAAEELLTEVLRSGVTGVTPETTDVEIDEETLQECEIALIRASGVFDAAGYARANRELKALRERTQDPIEHFVTDGWEWLRNPRSDFDLWWYWFEHLDPTQDLINPLVHYLIVGVHEGLPTAPPPGTVRPAPPMADATTRRICLFAAYDIDHTIDDYVVAYLEELSRHADVYYLADGLMSEEELGKLAHVTKGAWAVKHGRYDFGSFAMLADELVGWHVIDEYDELLLANDSCFLLRPLDDVFGRMAEVPADWWGLQATKVDFRELDGDRTPIPLAEAKQLHRERDDWYLYYRLHLSSYFLLFRKRVMDDAGFRRRLSTVVGQKHKGLVVLKYEIGISDYLLDSGFDCETFVPDLYPFHPLYTNDYFELVERGFPLLKRNFITDNSLRIPDLAQWQERILAHVPDAPIAMFQANVERVSADDALKRSLAVHTRPDGTIDYHDTVSRKDFRELDRATPKYDHWWAFPVCAYDHTFAGNERAVFEEVRDDPSIKKVILTRTRRVEVSGENVVIVPVHSPEGQYYLARSRFLFVKHGPATNVIPWTISSTDHTVINLWHGIPLKRFGSSALSLTESQHASVIRNNGGSHAVVASSRMDAMAMAASFYPASYPDVWPLGLPRNDFVVRPDDLLPADLRASVEQLRAEVAGRRLVLFLPTFKDDQDEAYYRFTDADVAKLKSWAERHHAVIGVREHMADKARLYSAMLAPLKPIDVSSRRYPDLEVLYRVADALVSDYSSCLVDFMLTGKPVISFAYDYDRYAGSERGLLYDLDRVLPGPVCRDFDALVDALDDVFRPRSEAETEDYEWRRRIFFDHLDDQASRRVVQRVRSLYVDGI